MYILTTFILYIASASSLCFGILLMNKRKKCNKAINAIFLRNDTIRVPKGCTKCLPVFRYEYNGCQYEGHSFVSFTKGTVKKYVPEKMYIIYVNAYKPKDFVLTLRTNPSEILFIVLGIFLGAFAFFLSLI